MPRPFIALLGSLGGGKTLREDRVGTIFTQTHSTRRFLCQTFPAPYRLVRALTTDTSF